MVLNLARVLIWLCLWTMYVRTSCLCRMCAWGRRRVPTRRLLYDKRKRVRNYIRGSSILNGWWCFIIIITIQLRRFIINLLKDTIWLWKIFLQIRCLVDKIHSHINYIITRWWKYVPHNHVARLLRRTGTLASIISHLKYVSWFYQWQRTKKIKFLWLFQKKIY